MRVALVHDYLNQWGGGERVLQALCEIFPKAPIYTLLYDEQRTGYAFKGKKIYTSYLQRFSFVRKHHRPFLMFMPLAIEQFVLTDYDLVISDSASYAKGIITGAETRHICYCHTPMRYAWDDSHKYTEEFGYPNIVKLAIPFFMNYVRLWDEHAAQGVDQYIANSRFVSQRIKKYYNRESVVIHPPVMTDLFYAVAKPDNYFLIVGRFLPYKKFDLAIEAFNELGWPLKIIGDGPDRKRLMAMANSNVEFVGLVSDQKLRDYFARAQAFIFPQEEDFGITAVESLASGRPVIAYQAGGVKEIIKENLSGIFFQKQTKDQLINALLRFKNASFNPQVVRQEALRFDKQNFKRHIIDYLGL